MSPEQLLDPGHGPAARRHRRDGGFTLPELLVTVSIMALTITALTASVIVTVRQSASTTGRVNVARAEGSLGTWLPSDLASIDTSDVALPAVDLAPDAVPCGPCPPGVDLSGSNALQLAWTSTGPGPTTFTTRVQYQYVHVGDEWRLERVMCSDASGSTVCSTNVVLHDLLPPPDPATYDPDTTRPSWVLDVSIPLADAPGLDASAKRLVITIDGGGPSAGAGGGLNTVSLTAGGVVTSEIDPDAFSVPTFVRARSRCGGPVTLIVDDSGSIGSTTMTDVVEPGVRAFVEAFRGTPTQVQIVKFSATATAIGPGSSWHRYTEMTDDAAVDALIAAVDPALTSGGVTNWEEAFFHTLKNSDGSVADTLPNRIVFFTDGVPTRHRADGSSYRNGSYVHFNNGPYDTAAGWPASNGSKFHQESFDRADVILDAHRDVDLIFVGVGGITGTPSSPNWIHNPAAYTDRTAPPSAAVVKSYRNALAWLLVNGPSGEVEAVYDGAAGRYTNPLTADLYLQSTFDQTAFGAAMRAAALKDCGGTLTIQTRLEGSGAPVNDEFVYENTEYRIDDTSTVVAADPRRVTTSAAFRTGTFDFEIPANVHHFSVDVVLQGLQTLRDFRFVGWSCRAGSTVKPIVTAPIDDGGSPTEWERLTVDVLPNEAVACTMTVRPG